MSSSATKQPSFLFSYTVCLYVVAAFALMSVAGHQMLIVMMQEGSDEVVTAVFRLIQTVELILFAAALTVAILRSKQSPHARPTTAAVSILLAIWAPIGTIVFIWWVGWVRRRERLDDSSE